MSDIWEKLLKAEDESERQIQKAKEEAESYSSKKREEAQKQVNKLREEYKEKLERIKQEADQEIVNMQNSLQAGQSEKKQAAASQVLICKDQIVELLIKTVLKVDLA